MATRGVVFDMDGVLADSEPVYFAAMEAVLAPLGHAVTEKYQREIMGLSIQDTWPYLRNHFSLATGPSRIYEHGTVAPRPASGWMRCGGVSSRWVVS